MAQRQLRLGVGGLCISLLFHPSLTSRFSYPRSLSRACRSPFDSSCSFESWRGSGPRLKPLPAETKARRPCELCRRFTNTHKTHCVFRTSAPKRTLKNQKPEYRHLASNRGIRNWSASSYHSQSFDRQRSPQKLSQRKFVMQMRTGCSDEVNKLTLVDS